MPILQNIECQLMHNFSIPGGQHLCSELCKSIVLPGPRLDSLSALECKEKQVLKEVSATNYLSVFIELFIEVQ